MSTDILISGKLAGEGILRFQPERPEGSEGKAFEFQIVYAKHLFDLIEIRFDLILIDQETDQFSESLP